MLTGNGINTVTVNGKVKHITELDDITLCLEWTKLREENNRLYEINNPGANRGWRGFILRLIGVNLPDKRTEFYTTSLIDAQNFGFGHEKVTKPRNRHKYDSSHEKAERDRVIQKSNYFFSYSIIGFTYFL